MSTGHRGFEKKSDTELYHMLGEGDTAELYAGPIKLDTSHDIPYAGGNSVDRKTVYIDRRLYAEVMSGTVSVRGMSPRQIIQAWVEHEHTEKSVADGDNPVDSYIAAHGFAEAKEDKFVRMLGIKNTERYEEAIEPALKRCLMRYPDNPPKDLWCAPYVSDPNKRDMEILRIFRAKGLEDAFKVAKGSVGYGIGAEKCQDCRHYGGEKPLAKCEIVAGLVRCNRQCDRFQAKGK